MAERRDDHIRRVLPLEHQNVRRRINFNPGVGPSTQPQVPRGIVRPRPAYVPPPTTLVTTPRKHHGVIRGIRRRMGNLPTRDINIDRDDVEHPRVREEWSSEEDITTEEGSGDEYVPPGATGERGRESELEFSGVSGFEEEEEKHCVDDDNDSDGESEGDGPARPMGVGGRVRGRASKRGEEEEEQHCVDDDNECDGESEGDGPARPRGVGGRVRGLDSKRGRGRRRSSGGDVSDEGWSEDPTPPVMHPFTAVPGLTVPVPTTPLGFLQLFLTRELLEYLVAETVDYARYCRDGLEKTLSYRWLGCNIIDMAHYLGLQVFFGLMAAADIRLY